jgi:hypothetical protein
MVGLTQLVNDSLVRHGVTTSLDPQRLQWSSWLPCQQGLSFLRIPDKAGIFALAEELIGPGESAATGGKGMMAIYRISETEELGLALARLFLPRSPECERFATRRCFARYTVIEDAAQRQIALAAFQQWMTAMTDPRPEPQNGNEAPMFESPAPLPTGF